MEIDRQLAASGWVVQGQKALNLSAGPGVAVREFTLEKPHGWVDYLLFLNGQPAGVIEAKPEGDTLTEVERQSGKYVEGLPDWMSKPGVYPLPFIYESTGAETRFTHGYDPEARSRRVFTFHRPQTLIEWSRQITGTGTGLRSVPGCGRCRRWMSAGCGASRRRRSVTLRNRWLRQDVRRGERGQLTPRTPALRTSYSQARPPAYDPTTSHLRKQRDPEPT